MGGAQTPPAPGPVNRFPDPREMQGGRYVASFSLGALAGVGAAAGLFRLKYPERYGDAELPAAEHAELDRGLFKLAIGFRPRTRSHSHASPQSHSHVLNPTAM